MPRGTLLSYGLLFQGGPFYRVRLEVGEQSWWHLHHHQTKVPVTVSEFGDGYTLLGPLSYKTAPMEVEAQEPSDPHIAAALDAMRNKGVKALCGRWVIEGAPLSFCSTLAACTIDWQVEGDLWNLAGIPLLRTIMKRMRQSSLAT